MSRQTRKPQRESPVTNNNTGRVTHDERGNAIWEWAGSAGTPKPESARQKLEKLNNPTLALADDSPPPVERVKHNPLGTVKGYSPYDSGLLHKKKTSAKKDLRRLSEWLKLKKQAAGRTPEE